MTRWGLPWIGKIVPKGWKEIDHGQALERTKDEPHQVAKETSDQDGARARQGGKKTEVEIMKGIVNKITAPDGTVWRVGDKVRVAAIYDFPEKETKIVGIFPGNGSWDREQPHGDADAVWFSLADGYMARPWLCTQEDKKP